MSQPYNIVNKRPAPKGELTYDGSSGWSEGGNYSTEPPNLRTIALLHERYADREAALARAHQLAALRGEKVYRLFSTARAWVAQVYKPLAVGEGYK